MPNQLTAGLELEQDLWAQGYKCVIGIDEAGRGAWAGPVMAGAVCLPPDVRDLRKILVGVRDSKQMTARARVNLIDHIKATALAWGVGAASASEIDTIGIVPATCIAMQRAVALLRAQFPDVTPDFLLMDSIRCTIFEIGTLPSRAIVKGDRLSLSIAAASVLAKVTRDQVMIEADTTHPHYGFAIHKGYGVPKHAQALREHGGTPFHRHSFAPLRALKNTPLPDIKP